MVDNFQFKEEVYSYYSWKYNYFTGKKTDFKLPSQTKSALVTTLRAQADLLDELIDDGYKFVKTTRFQVIPLKGVFNNIGK